MPDNFFAEKVSSADQIFATDFRASDSAHFPIGKLAHGALNTFTLTTTSDPFPVKLFGNDSTAPVHFTTDSGSPPVFTSILNTSSVVTGAALSTQISLDSTAKSITTAATRLYGFAFFNPDTAANIFAKIFQDDSAGVTLGTTEPAMNLMIPFGGGFIETFPQGISMSSGLSIATAAGVGSTVHDAPATTAIVTLWYTPST